MAAVYRSLLALSLLIAVAGCNPQASAPSPPDASARADGPVPRDEAACVEVSAGFGPSGTVPVEAEPVASGLTVPWGLAFLPNGDLLVTERPGRLRLVRNGHLLATPVATVETGSSAEGGLLGLALHPDVAQNGLVYLYVTAAGAGGTTNRVELWRLSADRTQAQRVRVVFDGLAAARYHNGGRLRFGPDGMLYVGTGDAREPRLSRDARHPNGALLRLRPDGTVPADNPTPGSPVFLSGIRNTQGWDWPDAGDASTVWITDHGPSGELGRRGHDEVTVARAGDNLGWPEVSGCERAQDLTAPVLTWKQAAPPGGAAVYTGTAIPEWRGSLLVGTLGSEHLHRVHIENGRLVAHEGYFAGELGRLRETVMGPDGHLYITTSNCDGRGTCPPEGDQILRVVPARQVGI